MTVLKELIDQLPPQLEEEVQDFVEFLLEKKCSKKKNTKLKLDWVGALEDYRDQFTSLEFQKKASDWRRI